jgi:hypothetical protein
MRGRRPCGVVVWASGGACGGPGAWRASAAGEGAIVGPGQPLSAGRFRVNLGGRLAGSDAWAG